MLGEEGASVVVAATDERQAGIVFNTARRMVELEEELSSRVQVFKDRLVVPERGASFVCLPADPKRLEGLDFTTAILDEIGVVSRDTYEVLALAQGKRETSTLLGIGTELGTDSDDDLVRALRRGSQDTINQMGQQIVRRQLNEQPTLTIRPGHPLRVILTRDLILEPAGEAR